MARTAFGDAFSRSFDSAVATYRREKENEQAEERLNRRMDRQREQDALDEAAGLGVYLPNALNLDGSYNAQTLKSLSAKARDEASKVKQKENWEFQQAMEGAVRDRVEGEAIRESASEMAKLYPDVSFDFNSPDWRSQVAAHKEAVVHNENRAISGMALKPLTQQWYNERTGAYSKEKPPVAFGVPLESGEYLSPEPDKFRMSLEPGRVTPEMKSEFAEFNRERVIKEGEAAADRATARAQEVKDKDTMAKMASMTPSQLAHFESLYGKGVVTSDIPILSHQISQSEKLYEKQYNLLEDIDKRNIAYYNEMAGRIPQWATVIDPETKRPVPFVPRRDPNNGAYNREDIEVMKQSLRLVETGDSFNKSQNWVWDAKPPSLREDVHPIKPGGKPPVIRAVPEFEAGPTGLGIGVKERPIGMPEALPPLEGDKIKDFWRGRGVTEHTYAASKNIFDAIGQVDGAAGEERYSFGGGDTVGGDNTKGATVSPLKGGIGAVNPAYESLFGAAMSRVKAQEFLMDAKVARIRAESQELNDKLPSLSARDSIILERKIKEFKKNEVDTIKEQLKLRGLRHSLIKSTGN